MNNKVVLWILIVVVIVIWANMIRISIPVIIESIRMNNEEQGELVKFQPSGVVREDAYTYTEPLRNPFERNVKVVKHTKNVDVIRKDNVEVYSLFNFRGSFSINGKRVAILEGRSDLGISGVFYVSEGESIMNEKVVEIGESYIIILKDGVRLTLYEVR